MVLLCSNIKKILGNPDKNSLYFRKRKPLKSFLHFGKLNLSVCPIKLFIFQKTETSKKLLMFSQKKAYLIFWKPSKNYLCFRKRNFLVFRERYSQHIQTFQHMFSTYNPSIFRGRSIFRTIAYLEPAAFGKLPSIYDGTFCKNSYLAHFLIF